MVMQYPKRRMLCVAAAAALGSGVSDLHAYAFSTPLAPRNHVTRTANAIVPSPLSTSTRLYSSSGDKDGGGFLDKIKSAAKSILPKKWFQTEEEKRAELQRRQMQDEISGGIRQVLKDAPLPLRLFGDLVSPLVSSLAESVGEQQRQVQDLLEDARLYLVRDAAVTSLLGEPIVVQSPFSQSSSTSNINGKTTSQTQASFYVKGPYKSGVAQMTASQDGITDLALQVDGRTLRVNLSLVGGGYTSTPYSSASGLGKNPKNKGDVIDVEFTEKTKK